MGLDDYKKKRDFKKTSEPEGKAEERAGEHRFVIQRHDARRLHYDLRLEMEGVLKSWAVPKGPSLNPADKRLAIMTEDHPMEYLSFKGEIPKGNYGAGKMEIWDTGTFTSASIQSEDPAENEKALLAGLRKGDLKFNLNGRKIKGSFALVKIKDEEKENQWLLIKHRDEYSVDGPFDSEDYLDPSSEIPSGGTKKDNKIEIVGYGKPSLLTDLPKEAKKTEYPKVLPPMLAKLVDHPFSNPKWIFEIKWDGYRALAYVQKGKASLYSRKGLKFDKYQPIVDDLNDLPYDVVLDGEVVVLNEEGRADFQKLQNYNSAYNNRLYYQAFDILYFNGFDLTDVPLIERKPILQQVLLRLNRCLYSDHIEGKGEDFYKIAEQHDLEGIIGKRKNSVYLYGKRTSDWVKIKTQKMQEAVVAGYTAPKGGRSYFGSLVLGIYDDNKELKYIGSSGGGFKENQLKEIYERLQDLRQDQSPFKEKIPGNAKITWVKPELVCEIAFSEWTEEGNLRHPVFIGLREDKSPEEVKKEVEEPAEVVREEAEGIPLTESAKKKVTSKKGDSRSIKANTHTIIVSNWNKVYWPEEKYTKGDLVEYYEAVADVMVPYLKDRPESLNRYPDGIYGESFYQKDMAGLLPDWIPFYEVDRESVESTIKYMLCQNKASLLFMANLGCIEIHPWSSRIQKPDHPDWIVMDIDPSEGNTFEEVIEVAQAIKEVLDKAEALGYCKTSGASGIHIYIPLGAKYTYEQGKNFANVIAIYANRLLPKLTTLERMVNKRKGRIYIDYLQNNKGQTLAAPYSARPKPGATVSAPLRWSEVKSGLHPGQFTIKNMPDRIKEVGDLFTPVIGEGIDMLKCLERLEKK